MSRRAKLLAVLAAALSVAAGLAAAVMARDNGPEAAPQFTGTTFEELQDQLTAESIAESPEWYADGYEVGREFGATMTKYPDCYDALEQGRPAYTNWPPERVGAFMGGCWDAASGHPRRDR